MAGRRVCINKAVVVAMAVAALLALLFAAGEADCNVNEATVLSQCASACSGSGGEPRPSNGCCGALGNANYDCLCKRYKSQLKSNSPYASCVKAIPSKCNPNAPKSCY